MNTDDLLTAADPYPEQSVEGLPLRAESQALMEEIMTTPTKTPAHNEPRARRRPRWVAPVVAAATVAAVVAGAVALIGPQSEQDSPTDGAPAARQSDRGPELQEDGPPVLQDEVPPPTAGNLRYVALLADDWKMLDLSNGGRGGSLAWSNGESSLEVTWYEAGDHRSYLNDRDDGDATKERASLLGQKGWAFRTRYTDSEDEQWWASKSAPKASRGLEQSGKKESGKKVLRVETMLPPVGDWFLAINAEVPNEEAYQDLVASLTRVDRRTWLATLNDSVIQPKDAEAFLDEVGRGVPMPPDVTVTPEDLSLPQSPYQARAAFVTPVMCGWAEEFVAGDEHALTVLRESKDWPVMDALAEDGDLPAGLRSDVRWLANHPKYDGWRAEWGC